MSSHKNVNQDGEMNLTGHLSELRRRLIWTAIVFIVFFIVGFIYIEPIYHLFVDNLDFTLTIISPGEIIWIYFSMAGLVSLIFTIPFLSVQIWLFVHPALTPVERKVSLSYIPAIFLLFIGGLAFGYYIFVDFVFPFIRSLNDGMFNEMFTVDSYFRFLMRITLPFAILFEIPILSMFLTSLGVLTPDFMKKTRKYAYLVLVIIGTMISPPDFVLQLVVAVPLIVLYEISIFLSGIVFRKKQQKHEAFMNQEE